MLPLFVVTTVTLSIILLFVLHKLEGAYSAKNFWYGAWYNECEASLKLQIQLNEKIVEYLDLDQGTNEIEENYQQEILSYHDRLTATTAACLLAQKDRDVLLEMLVPHVNECLTSIVIPMTEEQEEVVERLTTE